MNTEKLMKIAESVVETVVWKIDKFDSKTGARIGHEEFLGNCLCEEGIEEWFKLIGTSGAVQYDNTNAFLIVGTGSGQLRLQTPKLLSQLVSLLEWKQLIHKFLLRLLTNARGNLVMEVR